jgi:transketolase
VGSSNLTTFKAEFPDRMINVGIAEQDLVGVAAGLANGGLIPFVSAAAPFLTARALEQIKVDVAYSQAHVVLCGQSPGMAYGELGPTHHSIEDLSWLRAIADLPVVVPADPAQTVQAVRWAAANLGPSYVRIPRFPVPDVTPPGSPFLPGQAIQLTDGNDVTIIAAGTMVSRALQAAELLRQEDIQARVLNIIFVEPLDTYAILTAAAQTAGIVTAEEATTTGWARRWRR